MVRSLIGSSTRNGDASDQGAGGDEFGTPNPLLGPEDRASRPISRLRVPEARFASPDSQIFISPVGHSFQNRERGQRTIREVFKYYPWDRVPMQPARPFTAMLPTAAQPASCIASHSAPQSADCTTTQSMQSPPPSPEYIPALVSSTSPYSSSVSAHSVKPNSISTTAARARWGPRLEEHGGGECYTKGGADAPRTWI